MEIFLFIYLFVCGCSRLPSVPDLFFVQQSMLFPFPRILKIMKKHPAHISIIMIRTVHEIPQPDP
jgi:hypothetical protein